MKNYWNKFPEYIKLIAIAIFIQISPILIFGFEGSWNMVSGKWLWNGMPYWFCIGNWFFSTIICTARISVGIDYYSFVDINSRIREYNLQVGQTEADDTWKWFTKVFKTCANVRFVNVLCFFIGLYWLMAIFDVINAYVINKTLNIYKRQEEIFKQKQITQEDIKVAEKKAKTKILDEILNLDLTPDALEKVKSLKNR